MLIDGRIAFIDQQSPINNQQSPMFSLDDTIAAIASPPGGAARGIVRISGPRAMECLASVWGGTENLVGGADILV
ncbi:MAG: hypothetical protein WBL72_09055, partial [Thermoguttaceae bacterium]